MKHSAFIAALDDHKNLEKIDVGELEQLVKKYPHFQTAHLLLAAKYRQIDHPGYEKQLKKAALYAGDRNRFYDRIHPEKAGLPAASPPDKIKAPPLPTGDPTAAKVTDTPAPSGTPVKADPTIKKTVPPPAEPRKPEPIKSVEPKKPEPVKSAEPGKSEPVKSGEPKTPPPIPVKPAASTPVKESEKSRPADIKATDRKVDKKPEVEPAKPEKETPPAESKKLEPAKPVEPKQTIPPAASGEKPEKAATTDSPQPEPGQKTPPDKKPSPPPKVEEKPKAAAMKKAPAGPSTDPGKPPEEPVEPVKKPPPTGKAPQADPPKQPAREKQPSVAKEKKADSLKQEKPVSSTGKEPPAPQQEKPAKKKAAPQDGKHSFLEWLSRYKEPEQQTKKTKAAPVAEKQRSERKKSPPAEKKVPESWDVTEMARQSIQQHDDLVSETLANILTLQEKYDKALQMYEKLSLKYPEKSRYFADQIEKIKKKQ